MFQPTGFKETVIDGITGRLIDDIDEHKLAYTIREVREGPERYKDACIEQAKQFDTNIFISKIKEQLTNSSR